MYIVKKKEIPIWKKDFITIEEASAFSNISISTLRRLTRRKDSPIGEWVETRLFISRVKLEKFIEETKYIE